MNGKNPYAQENLEVISSLTKTSRITSLDWGNDNTEVLIGRIEPIVKVYSTSASEYISTHTFSNGPIVGLVNYNNKLIAGLGNGKIQIGDKNPAYLETGDDISRLRQCSVDRKLIATGGKERQNNLKVWNLETNECIFKTKNIPNDFLQLEVPVWDSDVGFIDGNCLATCSRYGYIRAYDMRKQRRPIGIYTNVKEQIGYTSLALHGNIIICGSTLGIARAFDIRKMNQILHTFKGFSGSITDIAVDETGKYLCSGSLDRYVRVHEIESTALMYQCYVKSKATRVLIRQGLPEFEIKEEEFESEEEEGTTDDIEIISNDNSDENDSDLDDIFNQMQTVGDESENKQRKRKVVVPIKSEKTVKIPRKKKK